MNVVEARPATSESLRSTAEVLDEVRTLAPDQQFCALNPHSRYAPWYGQLDAECTPADIDAYVDFAADPDERLPLLVRVQAVQRIAEQIIRSPDTLNDYNRDLNSVLPTAPVAAASNTLQSRGVEPRGNLGVSWRLHNDLTWSLMHDAGISNEQTVFPEWDQWSFDPAFMPDFNPAMGMMYLAQMAEMGAPGKLQKLAPLAQAFQKECSRFVTDGPQDELEKTMPLLGVVGYADKGADHMVVADNLFRRTVGSDAAKVFTDLGRSARHLNEIFPKEYGVLHGVRELMANSLYALDEHYNNHGHTDIRLPLNNQPDILPLELSGDEPIELLRHLQRAIEIMGKCALSQDSLVVRATNEQGFAIYRLFSEGEQTSIYIRPQASPVYRQDSEYGRPGEGVEASIGFVTDPTLQPGQLLKIGKHRSPRPDSRISIRLDREGIKNENGNRDPASEQGVLSLDVGSIIGKDEWLSTKVGRFLAWGNLLRSQQVGEVSHLNHVRRYYDEYDGHAVTFARAAISFADRFESRALSVEQLAQIMGRSGSLSISR